MIFYEAPHKLRSTLRDMCDAFGEDRKISLCREITKLNEETIRLTLGEAVRLYEQSEPRGEYVLVLAGFDGINISSEIEELLSLPPEEHVQRYVDEGMTRMEATKRAAKDRGMSKSELYKILNA